jgi:phosphoglucomutase
MNAPDIAVSPLAGSIAPHSLLIDVPRLITAYYSLVPDARERAQQVSFGTSGHRGSAFKSTFNEWHVLAISQAICDYRKRRSIDGPLFLGMDTHALSVPACASALEVLAANAVQVMIAADDEYTPTPAVSHAILCYNRGRKSGLADGIVVTPSHNPPDDGGFKYNPPDGGPADAAVTAWIQERANALHADGQAGVNRVSYETARRAPSTHRHDYIGQYVQDLGAVIDLEAIRSAGLTVGVDPLGGAGVHYWGRIGEQYGIALEVVNAEVDPTFRFMSVDWDGKIRMDPSSRYAMQPLLALTGRFDIACASDTDHDRHGIVTRTAGLLPTNHFLCAAVDYLFRHREGWRADAAVGKTMVSTQLLDRVAARLERRLFEVPVGFKWFVEGLASGAIGFAGEESAGATFARWDGSAWTTDKDGITPGLLAAEMTARLGTDPGEQYRAIARALGDPVGSRIDAPATPEQKRILAQLSAGEVTSRTLAGAPIRAVLTEAPGSQGRLGGIKVVTDEGWFAARPSGTEDIYKIYAESFRDADHLQSIFEEAQAIVRRALAAAAQSA